ncbi:MAG: hypothetical protein FJ301_09715 [Planctomycetes bacterium]|nr:hypothetical protein [Planctomycetota bacterium]
MTTTKGSEEVAQAAMGRRAKGWPQRSLTLAKIQEVIGPRKRAGTASSEEWPLAEGPSMSTATLDLRLVEARQRAALELLVGVRFAAKERA